MKASRLGRGTSKELRRYNGEVLLIQLTVDECGYGILSVGMGIIDGKIKSPRPNFISVMGPKHVI